MSKQAAFIAIALAIAIAGFIGWSLRGRPQTPVAVTSTIDPDAANVPGTPSEPQSSFAGGMRSAPLPARRPDGRDLMLANAQKVAKQVQAGRQRLSERYASEPVSTAWAAQTEKSLDAAKDGPQIDQLGAKPLSFAAQCRSSVCLINADFPSTDAADDWFTLYTMESGAQIANSVSHHSQNPDGTVHLEIYGLARGR